MDTALLTEEEALAEAPPLLETEVLSQLARAGEMYVGGFHRERL